MDYKLRNGLYYDTVEDTEEYKRVIDRIEKQTEARMENAPRGMGNCHIYWNIKKQLLKDVGIDWHSPAECNPTVMFD